jgi:hypothetical protein
MGPQSAHSKLWYAMSRRLGCASTTACINGSWHFGQISPRDKTSDMGASIRIQLRCSGRGFPSRGLYVTVPTTFCYLRRARVSECPHMGQSKSRLSNPGLSGLICVSTIGSRTAPLTVQIQRTKGSCSEAAVLALQPLDRNIFESRVWLNNGKLYGLTAFWAALFYGQDHRHGRGQFGRL